MRGTELAGDFAALLRGVMRHDLNGAGALADWLDEHGDDRGPLLRRRWRRWLNERRKAAAGEAVIQQEFRQRWHELEHLVRSYGGHWEAKIEAGLLVRADERFRAYLTERFLWELNNLYPDD